MTHPDRMQPIPVESELPVAVPVGEGEFTLALPVFEGPLQLLLHLIESRQLDILTVPLAEVADAYVEHLARHPVDAAKGHKMRLWHRVAGVLLEAFAPALLRRLASPDPASRRHAFHLYLHHAELSAEMAMAAGCGPRAGAFIRGSAAGDDARLQRALTEADDAS